MIASLTYAAKNNAKWFQQSLSQHKVYESEAISTITYKTRRSISPTRYQFSALHYNDAKTQVFPNNCFLHQIQSNMQINKYSVSNLWLALVFCEISSNSAILSEALWLHLSLFCKKKFTWFKQLLASHKQMFTRNRQFSSTK